MSAAHCIVAFALLVAHAAGSAAGPGDAARGDAAGASCRLALDRLAAHESQMASRTARDAQGTPSGPAPAGDAASASPLLQRHAALRREASVACLGAPPPQAQRRPFAEPPVAVPPVAAPDRVAPGTVGEADAARAQRPSQRHAPAAPPAPRPPTAITSCDALGCWANDGSRLNRMGPDLVGERGVCRAQGRTLRGP